MPSCPRCGAPTISLADLANEAREAIFALDNRRLAIPDTVRAGLVLLASCLPCHAGQCRPRLQVGPAPQDPANEAPGASVGQPGGDQ